MCIISFIYDVGNGKWSCTGFIFKRAGIVVLLCLHDYHYYIKVWTDYNSYLSKVCGPLFFLSYIHKYIYLCWWPNFSYWEPFWLISFSNRWQLPNSHKCLHFHYKKEAPLSLTMFTCGLHFVHRNFYYSKTHCHKIYDLFTFDPFICIITDHLSMYLTLAANSVKKTL